MSQRLKILPDRIFHRLWDGCKSVESQETYIKKYLSPLSSDYIDFFKKYDISELKAGEMLKNIYHAYHLSFKDILTQAEARQSEISHIFCIPTRTIEEWHSGNNRCPGYIRLMLLRHFYLLNLGKYIAIESDIKHKGAKPPIYNVREKTPDKAVTQINNFIGSTGSSTTLNTDETGPYGNKGNDDSSNIISRTSYGKMREDLDAMEYTTPAEEILKRTDYLKSRINSHKKP